MSKHKNPYFFTQRYHAKALRRKRRKKSVPKLGVNELPRKNRTTIGIKEDPFLKQRKEVHSIHEAPACFSFRENPEKMIQYFTAIRSYLNGISKTQKKTLDVNMCDVKKASLDATLCLMALCNESRRKNKKVFFRYTCPESNVTRAFFDNCFVSHLLAVTSAKELAYSNNEWTILSAKTGCGNGNDETATGTISYVLNEVFKKFAIIYGNSTKECSIVYDILSEITENVANNAQRQETKNEQASHQESRHYVLIRECIDKVEVVYLDVSEGIPESIRQEYPAADLANIRDGDIIAQALNGTLDVDTSNHRGKGLNSVYKYAVNNEIHKLFIISNRGYYVLQDGAISAKTLNGNLKGTLYSWSVPKPLPSAPSVFSLRDNASEVILFLNPLLTPTEKVEDTNVTLGIDMASVKYASLDAVIYLMACVSHLRLHGKNVDLQLYNSKSYDTNGLLQRCGFEAFACSSSQNLKFADKKIIAFSGERATPYMFKQLMKRLDSKLDIGVKCKSVLYEMLSELSENAWKYAYPDKRQHGYIYMIIEEKEASMSVFFLDLGVGIPNSVRHKHSRSRIDNKWKWVNGDSDIIARALLGDYRISSTGLKKHGKGLPMIFSTVAKKYVCELTILSGSAYCYLSHSHRVKLEDLPENFTGTLFCWEMRKQLS